MQRRCTIIRTALVLFVSAQLLQLSLAATASDDVDGVSFVTVSTPSGTYRGISRNNYNAFLGIRYAQPPLGSLRWSAPVAMPASSGVVNATEFGSSCMQPSSERPYTSEDCLFLNVWAPPSCATRPTPCSVLVHIHGGGWVTGAGSDAMYWGDFFANTTDTIVVTFNYRLGALGFLVLPADADTLVGNFGFLDQRMALQWVSRNIPSFGGGGAVTLQGQSAGGISVATHLTAPKSFGLFQQVAVLSNPTAIALRPIENCTHFSNAFARHLGCDLSDRTCLEAKNASEILAAQMLVRPDILPPFPLDNSMISPWMIVVDHVNVLDSPSRLVQLKMVREYCLVRFDSMLIRYWFDSMLIRFD